MAPRPILVYLRFLIVNEGVLISAQDLVLNINDRALLDRASLALSAGIASGLWVATVLANRPSCASWPVKPRWMTV